MEWFLGHQRGPPWKHSWASRALSSAALPPWPLIAVLAIVLLLLSLSGYADYRAYARRTAVGFHLLLFILPVALLLAAVYSFRDGRLQAARPWWVEQTAATQQRGGSSPCGVGLVVLLLLVMVSYQSFFHSQWFRGLWGSPY